MHAPFPIRTPWAQSIPMHDRHMKRTRRSLFCVFSGICVVLSENQKAIPSLALWGNHLFCRCGQPREVEAERYESLHRRHEKG